MIPLQQKEDPTTGREACLDDIPDFCQKYRLPGSWNLIMQTQVERLFTGSRTWARVPAIALIIGDGITRPIGAPPFLYGRLLILSAD
jgi:hypothetical protein